jgi:hypothetical protein
MKNKALIFSLIAVFVVVILAGCSQEKVSEKVTSMIEDRMDPVEVESVTICKSVDSNQAPVDPMNIFPSGTQVVYVSVKINNMTTKDKLTTKWNYLETGEEFGTADITTEEPGSGYVGFNLTINQGFPSGRYNTTVYLNNEAQETVEFSVE